MHLLNPFGRRNRPVLITPHYRAKRLWLRFLVLVLLPVFYVQAVAWNFLWLFGSSPSLENVENTRPAQASHIYTSDGKQVGMYFRENRSPVEYNQISGYLINALFATEDIRFYEHSGVDPEATGSIIWYLARGDNRGGSTITQQLAKNLYNTRRGSSQGLLGGIPLIGTIISKTKEWITAIRLEQLYTKEEILTMYMNTVDFGRNSFGVKTAAETFFDRTPDSLQVEQAAMLIGMLKATSSYNPYKNYGRAFKRRNTVISQMAKYGFITKHVADSVSRIPIVLRERADIHPDGAVDYYGQWLTSELKRWAKEKDPDYIYKSGLRIYITIDSKMQAHAEAAMQEHMKSLQDKFDKHWKGKNPWVDEQYNEIPLFIETLIRRTDIYRILKAKYKGNEDSINVALNTPKQMVVFNWNKPSGDTVIMSSMDSLRYCKRLLHAGLMTMDPFSGHIKAWVGGINYKFFKYDHVKQSRRQPGSTFKAFVYAAAMDRGWTPCDKIQDVPVTINYEELENGAMVKKSWSPHNATGTFTGMNMTLRFAIGRSINSVTAQLTQKLTPEVVADYAKRLGISSPIKAIPSIGLGSNDVTLYEMVGSYATFLNEGVYTEPSIISRIEDHNGNVIDQFRSRRQKVISPEAAFLMIHMLKGTLQEPGGTAQALFSYQVYRNNELAGKTGTSSNQSDGWFIGLTKDLVTGVWVGAEERSIHFRSLSMGEGAKTALPIYGLYMERLYADTAVKVDEGRFAKPSVKIKAHYNCPTHLPRPDTGATDSAVRQVRPETDMAPPTSGDGF